MFLDFFFVFSKFKFNFEDFQKQMTLKVDVFSNLPTTKNVVRYTCKKYRFRGPFHK